MIRLTWHGHACWELAADERRLVIDPHDGHSIGIPVPRVKADVVVVTHDHFDHNAVRTVERDGGATRAIVSPTGPQAAASGFQVTGVAAYHDGQGGRQRGEVRLIVVEAGGLRVAHLSDLGHALGPEQVRALGRVDILLVPAGGVFTLSAAEAWRTIEAVGPRVVVPMHYRTPGLSIPLNELEDFLGDREVAAMGRSVEVEAEDLPPTREIWVFHV
jgi:L-ascorbate metabolism protein UlaG (beta-lactamase superfamily)